MKNNKSLTPEELEFKRKSKNRIFLLLILLDLGMIALIVVQIINLTK